MIKNVLFKTFILLLLAVNFSLAQDELEVLVLKLDTAKGVARIDMLNKLSEKYRGKDLDKAISYAQEAIELSEKNNKLEKVAISQINKGVAYRSKGDSKPALEYFLKALVSAEKIGDLNIQADALHKIGVTYLFQKDFYAALKFAEKEQVIWKQINDDAGIASASNFLGLIYINLKNYDLARKALEESLQIGQRTADTELIYKPLTNLGDLYIRLGDLPKAIDYISQGLKVSEESGNQFGIATSLLSLGKAYKLKKDNVTAIEYAKKSLEKSVEIQALSLMRNAYELLTELYETTNDYQKSLFFHKLYKAAEDSLINRNVRQSMNEMELKYDAQKKEQENAALRIEKELFDKERNLTFAIITGTSLVALLAMIATVLYSRQSRLKQRVNTQLLGVNQEIIQKSDEIAAQRDFIEQINKNLVSSINYAKNIQDVLLPQKSNILNSFSGHFIYNAPRDIVSGDFNWFAEIDGQTVIAVGDCTGHGVPAALITVLCHSFLHEICAKTTSPSKILEGMNERVMAQLHHKEGLSNDGVEIAICIISADKTQLIYAGAKTPLYLVKNQVFTHIKANHFPIGDTHYSAERSYTEHIISIQKGDTIYLSSDGYQDQFGGDNDRKFMVKNFRNLLGKISQEDINEQANILKSTMQEWKGKNKQTDDIIVFGLRI